VSNSPTHHDIYCQVANRNFEDYHSKMEHQMYTKYNIQECNYQVGDLVKIQIAKINCRPTFLASEVLPLEPREFSELNNSPTYKNISIVEAARLQSNAFASNKGCNCR
ncbi:3594_t:CDS:2, partial [Scutellospora calospora]